MIILCLHSLLSKKNIYRLIIWILLIISGVVLVRLAPILTKPEYLRSDDFIRFWASGNLNVHRENPYDPAQIEQLQIEEGSLPSTLSTSSIMLNPPWVISILMPFGLIDYPISRLVWLIISIMLVIIILHCFSGVSIREAQNFAGWFSLLYSPSPQQYQCSKKDKWVEYCCWELWDFYILLKLIEMIGWQGYVWLSLSFKTSADPFILACTPIMVDSSTSLDDTHQHNQSQYYSYP